MVVVELAVLPFPAASVNVPSATETEPVPLCVFVVNLLFRGLASNGKEFVIDDWLTVNEHLLHCLLEFRVFKSTSGVNKIILEIVLGWTAPFVKNAILSLEPT
jgi:hypothetical protein